MQPQGKVISNPIAPNTSGLFAFVESAKDRLSQLPYLADTAYGVSFKAYPDNNNESIPYLYQGGSFDPATVFFNDNVDALCFFFAPDPQFGFDTSTGGVTTDYKGELWLIFHCFTVNVADYYGVDPYFATTLIDRDLQRALESANSGAGFATFKGIHKEPQNIYQGFTGLNRLGDNLFSPEKYACRLSFDIQYSTIDTCL